MNLVTLDQARFDLRVTDELTDDQVQGLIDDATNIVADYLKVSLWTDPATVPKVVISAIRLVMVSLFSDPSGQSDPLSDPVKNLLARQRDPALA